MNLLTSYLRFIIVLPFISVFLVACSGGGSDPAPVAVTPPPVTPPPVTPPVVTGPTWTKGVFEDASEFANQCETPRAGVNPATGSSYPDVAGSTLYENHWLRSWSNDTYLWYSEIEDVDPAGFDDPLTYFDVLKTTATTSSGNNKDNFHFTYDTAEYYDLVSSGASAGYGAEFAIIQGTPPREIRVVITEPNSPAANAPASLLRGTEILEIDGVSVVSGGTQADVDVLNAGLFPSAVGETHDFVVQDIGSTTTRSFSMTTAIVTSAAVQKVATVDTATGKVGYIMFNTFGIEDAETQIIDAIDQVSTAGVQDLVLDLRYNGGGFLDIAGQLGYMIAGATQTSGKTFDKITFNDKYPTLNPVTGQTLSPTPFHNTTIGFSEPAGVALPTLDLKRIFILSTGLTCSASEAVINGLRGVDVEVVLIGSTSCGKPYGFYATDNCGTTYFTIQFKGENDKGFGEYSDGFSPMNTSGAVGELVPGCEVGDDYLHQLGDAEEAMFATALSYRASGSCPAAVIANTPRLAKQSISEFLNDTQEGSLYNSERMRKHLLRKQIIDQGRTQQ